MAGREARRHDAASAGAPADARPVRALAEGFRQALLEERRRLLRTVVDTEEELATIEPHEAGAFVQETAREEALGLLSRLGIRERRMLEEVDAALARLRAGVFGACEACAEPIGVPRLRAAPTARYCLRCQVKRERPA